MSDNEDDQSSGRDPNGPPNPAQTLIRNAAQVTAALSALAFSVGYLATLGLADGLGVEQADLGLEFRDVVAMSLAAVLTSVLLVAPGLVMALLLVNWAGNNEGRIRWTIAGVVVAVIASALLLNALTAGDSVGWWMQALLYSSIGSFMFAALALVNEDRTVRLAVAVLLGVCAVVASSVISYQTTRSWASDSVAQIRNGEEVDSAPFAVRVIAGVTPGLVQVDDRWEPVVRYGRQVFVGCTRTYVLDDWGEFRVPPEPATCD